MKRALPAPCGGRGGGMGGRLVATAPLFSPVSCGAKRGKLRLGRK